MSCPWRSRGTIHAPQAGEPQKPSHLGRVYPAMSHGCLSERQQRDPSQKNYSRHSEDFWKWDKRMPWDSFNLTSACWKWYGIKKKAARGRVSTVKGEKLPPTGRSVNRAAPRYWQRISPSTPQNPGKLLRRGRLSPSLTVKVPKVPQTATLGPSLLNFY